MASFNGTKFDTFKITGSGATDTEQDIAADVISWNLEVQDQNAVESAAKDEGTRRSFVREDATLTVVFRKTTTANDAWSLFHDDRGPFAVNIDFPASHELGNFNVTMRRERLTAPYGNDGVQAFTVVLMESEGAPIVWS